MFQLNKIETAVLVTNCDRFKTLKHSSSLPYVFTEQGVAMLSSVLKSERAIEMNIIIMRAFVKIRNLIYSYKDLAEKVGKMEREIGRIFDILNKMRQPENDKKEEIGFKG